MRDAAYYESNQWERLSATRVNLFRRCPRWYSWKYAPGWHQEPRTAIMRAGGAVQRAFERVVKARPDDHALADDVTKSRMMTRGIEVAEQELCRARDEHEQDLGAVGPWGINPMRFRDWVTAALWLHWERVMRWRGALCPDGYTFADAWEAARPQLWPDGPEGGEVIPDGWFSYKPDAVYTEPDGSRVLVDIKVGKGSEPFGDENREQIRMYAWAEEQCGRRFDRLELWFLGRDDPVEVVEPWPSCAVFESDTMAIRGIDMEREWNAPRPSETWCAKCPFAEVCGASWVKRGWVGGVIFDSLSYSPELPLDARIIGIGEPKEKRGKQTRRVTLANSSGLRSYTWDAGDVTRLGIRAGRAYTFRGLRTWTCRYRGVQLDVGRETSAVEMEQEVTT